MFPVSKLLAGTAMTDGVDFKLSLIIQRLKQLDNVTVMRPVYLRYFGFTTATDPVGRLTNDAKGNSGTLWSRTHTSITDRGKVDCHYRVFAWPSKLVKSDDESGADTVSSSSAV